MDKEFIKELKKLENFKGIITVDLMFIEKKKKLKEDIKVSERKIAFYEKYNFQSRYTESSHRVISKFFKAEF